MATETYISLEDIQEFQWVQQLVFVKEMLDTVIDYSGVIAINYLFCIKWQKTVQQATYIRNTKTRKISLFDGSKWLLPMF